jgi:hypothetical protein
MLRLEAQIVPHVHGVACCSTQGQLAERQLLAQGRVQRRRRARSGGRSGVDMRLRGRGGGGTAGGLRAEARSGDPAGTTAGARSPGTHPPPAPCGPRLPHLFGRHPAILIVQAGGVHMQAPQPRMLRQQWQQLRQVTCGQPLRRAPLQVLQAPQARERAKRDGCGEGRPVERRCRRAAAAVRRAGGGRPAAGGRRRAAVALVGHVHAQLRQLAESGQRLHPWVVQALDACVCASQGKMRVGGRSGLRIESQRPPRHGWGREGGKESGGGWRRLCAPPAPSSAPRTNQPQGLEGGQALVVGQVVEIEVLQYR